ncbi:MAG: Ig-like domain-containing protein [Bacteroidota bacterium]
MHRLLVFICVILCFNGCKKDQPTSPVNGKENTPPMVSILAPLNNSNILDSSIVVVEAKSERGIQKVELSIDEITDSTRTLFFPPYTFVIKASTYQENSLHTIIAKAYDSSGRVATSQAVTVTFYRFAPSELIVTSLNDEEIRLAWKDNSSIESSFEVEESVNSGGFSFLKSAGKDTASVYIRKVFNTAQTYIFRVRAKKEAYNSGYSNNVKITGMTKGLCVGGNLTVAGTTSVALIAFWDGNTWSAMGAGSNGTVASILTYNNSLYYGNGSQNGIRYWNISNWATLGVGTNGNVSTLAVYNGELIVGGGFNSAENFPTPGVAKWDGSRWSAMGSPPFTFVDCLTLFEDKIYAIGRDFSAGVNGSWFSHWDGVQWQFPLGSSSESISSMCVHHGELYAAKQTNHSGSTSTNRGVFKWNGGGWTQIGSSFAITPFALQSFGNQLFAGGNFKAIGTDSINRVAAWDGNSWKSVAGGFNNAVQCFAVANNVLYAGGDFTASGIIPVNRIARWDGTSWNDVGGGVNNAIYVMAPFNQWKWESVP